MPCLIFYARPISETEPVICIDEKSLQLIAHSRAPLPMNSRGPEKLDHEHVRHGTTNLFVAVQLNTTHAKARRVHLVLDNLNIHFSKCFDDVLGKRAAAKLLRRVRLHYTPQARKLAEHGGDRDRHPQPSVSGATDRKPPRPAMRD